MVSHGKNITHRTLLKLKEHGTLLLSLGHISFHLVGGNRTHPPQHNQNPNYWKMKLHLHLFRRLSELKLIHGSE
jgi:hypothetical protein